MIFQNFRGQLLVVRQSDHGVQTGLFASRWGNESIPKFDPWQAVVDAGTQHDNGWIAWEAAPSMDPETGQPWQFYKLTPHEHVPLYRRGIQMAADHEPTTGLLVSMHGAGLYNDRYDTFRLAERHLSDAERVLVDEFLAEQALFQQSLGERIQGRQLQTHVTTDPQVWYNYLLLQVWDRLQLQFAWRLAADGEIAPLPSPDGSTSTLRVKNTGEFAIELDPYPFDADALVFPMAARLLPDKPYRNAEEFLAEMAKTPERSARMQGQQAELMPSSSDPHTPPEPHTAADHQSGRPVPGHPTLSSLPRTGDGAAPTPTPAPVDVVFLVDVDNTLLDNDRVTADLFRHLEREVGHERCHRYWEIFEQLRSELGYADYLGALQRYRVEYPRDSHTLVVSDYLVNYPFANRLYPGSLDTIDHLKQWGPVVILSDGDVVFQPRKVHRSGLFEAVDGNILIYIHKEEELDDVELRYPARHYVLIDDKLRILTAVKACWGERLTTIFPRQGHYALDPRILASHPPADITVDRIGDVTSLDLTAILTAATRPAESID